MLTPLEARTLDAIDRGALLSSLQSLIRIRSDQGREGAIQREVARQMEDRGLSVDLWAADQAELRAHGSYSTELEREEVLGVVGATGSGTGGRTLILNGHVDVVPPGDERRWQRSPWCGDQVDGEVYGRGSVDMKGGLAAALAAVQAVLDAGASVPGRVLLQSVAGEEDGGVGTLAAVLRGYRGDGAVIMEPTGLAVVPVHAGSLSFRIRVSGRAAHGALRAEGVSAVGKLPLVLAALEGLEARRNASVRHPLMARHGLPYPISVGRVEAGTWASTVPELLVCEGRFGVAPDESMDDARAAMAEALAACAEGDPWLAEHPPALEWWGGVFAPACTPADHPIVATVREAGSDVLGVAPSLDAMTAGTDLRLLVNEGRTPGVLFGPGDLRRAHAPDEAVPFDQVVAAAEVLALTILRFCGPPEPE